MTQDWSNHSQKTLRSDVQLCNESTQKPQRWSIYPIPTCPLVLATLSSISSDDSSSQIIETMAANETRAQARLTQELNELHQSPIDGCSVHPTNPNDILLPWTGTIIGPNDTPYQDGTFALTLHFPTTYPIGPPSVKMNTPIYHPNIDSKTGSIGLNILNTDWSPVLTAPKVLLSLQALLAEPDCEDAVMPEIAHECLTKREEYEETARAWTKRYAVRAVEARGVGGSVSA